MNIKPFLVLVFALSTFGLQSPTKADPSVAALPPGMYLKTANGWVSMDRITMSGAGAKHMAKLFLPGLTPQMVFTFRGADAPVQLADPSPMFLFKQPSYLEDIPGRSSRDLIIVRFDRKSNHRELQTTSGGNVFTYKAGFSSDRTPAIQVQKLDTGVFTVQPAQPLKSGEYLLTFSASGTTGFDFGIKPENPSKK